jgi:copper homeostasis protein
MRPVEICLNTDNLNFLKHNVEMVYAAGAARIELCSNMQADGLTPSVEAIKIARKAFNERKGLLVMIRPRSGDFFYDESEIIVMLAQIKQAAAAGANGVVFGVLMKNTNAESCLNIVSLEKLIHLSKSLGLQVSIHRAFDAIKDRQLALTQLIELGVERILTSGLLWGSKGSAIDGLPTLSKLVNKANNQIEIVIAGGICVNKAKIINQTLMEECLVSNRNVQNQRHTFSFHAYSSVLTEARIVIETVRGLVNLKICKQ